MHLTTALAIASLVSALVLMNNPARVWAIAALVASLIRVGMAIGLVSLKLKGVSLFLLLGCALAIGGCVLFGKTSAKTHVAAATVLCITGFAEIFRALQLIQFR